MFGAKPDEQRAYEERHPVYGPYFSTPEADRENAAIEAARRRHREYLERKQAAEE